MVQFSDIKQKPFRQEKEGSKQVEQKPKTQRHLPPKKINQPYSSEYLLFLFSRLLWGSKPRRAIYNMHATHAYC
jgi:hypothetical protein